MDKNISEKDRIEVLRKFFRISNAAVNCVTAIQSAMVGKVLDQPMYHLHRMALQEIEKENPNLEIIDYLLQQMEFLADEKSKDKTE